MRNFNRINYYQEQAVNAWVNQDFKGTIMLAPGLGKTFTSFHAAYRLLELGRINLGDTIIFLAETTVREKTVFEDEAPKYLELFGKDILKDFNLQFRCYQSMPVEEFDGFKDVALVIFDETQDCLSAKYSENIINSKCPHMIGLTGAMSLEQHVYPQDEETKVLEVYQTDEETKRGEVTEFISKGQLLEIYMPICYQATSRQAIKEGMISEFQTWIINHHLDTTKKYLKTWKSYDTLDTEQDYYIKKDNFRKNFRNNKFVRTNISRSELPNFLYNLKSKVKVVKALLKTLTGKTLIFGERLDILDEICPTIRSHNANELVDKFNSGELEVIASSKMLKQGITLEGVQNIIFFSYSSKWHNMEQRRARIRWIDDGQAKLFFFVTQGTLEEKWFDKINKEKDSKNKLKHEHDLNIVGHYDSRVLLNS